MKRAKSKNMKTTSSILKSTDKKNIATQINKKNIATQTTDFDSFLELNKLQEQLKLLQLENNVLKEYMQTFEQNDNVICHMSLHNITHTLPKTSTEKSICHCKGNCSSKKCGCVRKTSKCNPSCRCNENICQNKKLKEEQEDKENINKSNTEALKKQVKIKKNETAKKNKNNNLENDKITSNIEAEFDPMKPRHQLSRTPPNSKKVVEQSLESDNIILSQSCYKPSQQITIVSSTINDIEKEVDWEQHTAQLIPCKKCKRTFMPHRIQKHEACCKKI